MLKCPCPASVESIFIVNQSVSRSASILTSINYSFTKIVYPIFIRLQLFSFSSAFSLFSFSKVSCSFLMACLSSVLRGVWVKNLPRMSTFSCLASLFLSPTRSLDLYDKVRKTVFLVEYMKS